MGRKTEATYEQILELKKQDKSDKEIAEILEVSKNEVSRCIRRDREEKIIKLKQAGKENDEIAEILKISKVTVTRCIHSYDNPKSTNKTLVQQKSDVPLDNMIKTAETTNRDEETSQNQQLELQPKKKSKPKEEEKKAAEELKTKIQEHTITKKDIQSYQETLSKKDVITQKDINFMIKICIKTGQIYTAVKFIDIVIGKTPITEMLEIERLEEMKNKVKSIGKEQEIRRLLKGKVKVKTSAIAEQVGIPETEVIQIKHKIEQAQGIEM